MSAIEKMKGGLYSWRSASNDGDRNPATNEYKGLVSFIADIRSARARELEEKRINKELANIRSKFREGKLNSYDKKKYVCKLLYIYILGWELDFGHLEAVNLISANKFSEKQIGYLAVTLFFHEEHELLHLVVNSIRKDLLDHNELNNCLALHAIANIGGRAMAESLASEVYRLLISPASKSFVKKKAALTLLRLYRKLPTCVQPQWAERIVIAMDDENMGVALSVTSLVMALAQDDPELYRACYAKAANRLKRIAVDNDCAADYEYYQVPCPWMQVKLLRLLQYYPPSQDNNIRNLIRQSVAKILDMAMEAQKNVQQNNAQNAVLFEAIKLVIHLDTEEALMVQISSRLGKFILARETNVRYLGLEAMTHLASRSEAQDPIKKHQKSIFASLKDRDITVRRQSLDLLYSMCDQSNAQSIVTDLLRHLTLADYALREEMILKIAILAERYATDAQWYVDISLRLLAMAGDQVSEEVWQRVIQIVTNNEDLQVYAVKNILRYVKLEQCHESLIKIGGYLLGEFGHLIADETGCSPIEQFLALQNKMAGCSTETRSIILSAFIKFVNLFPEIKQQLIEVFRAFSDVLDSELQQRACEYLALATMPIDDVLRTVFDEMPPFPDRASALLLRVHTKAGKGGDKKPLTLRQDTTGFAKLAGVNSSNPSTPIKATNGNGYSNGNGALNGTGNDSHDLLDLQSSPQQPRSQHIAQDSLLLDALTLRSGGILYQSPSLHIALSTEYRASTGALMLYFQNKSSSSQITSLTSTINTSDPTLISVQATNSPDSTVTQMSQCQQTIMVEARNVFNEPPVLNVQYLDGSEPKQLLLKLPVLLHKYMEPAQLVAEDFFKRWKQIGGAPREAQEVFNMVDGARFTSQSTRAVCEGFNWGVLDGVDPKEGNFVGATVLCTSEGGKFGCLMRLEPNYSSQMYRLTIRTTGEGVAAVLLALMKERLQHGGLAFGLS